MVGVARGVEVSKNEKKKTSCIKRLIISNNKPTFMSTYSVSRTVVSMLRM